MAIKKQHEKFGIQFPNAYHRIEWMCLNILNGISTLEVVVVTYASQYDEEIFRKSYCIPVDKANVSLRYAYIQLSLLPDFSGGEEI